MVLEVRNKEGDVVDLDVATGGQQGEYVAAFPLERLVLPPYQRDQSPKKVQQIVTVGYSRMKAGVLLINVRDDGVIALMDGGHRRAAAMKSGLTHHAVLVWHGLSYEQEVDVWMGCNTNTRMANMVEKHKALREGGDMKAKIIEEAIQKAGVVVAPHTGGKDNKRHPNMLVAVSAAYVIYDTSDAQTLTYVLQQLRSYWPSDRLAITDDMLHGFYLFQAAYRGNFDERRMRMKCSALSIPRFRAGAIDKKYTHNSGMRRAIARNFLTLYNENLGKNRLPDLLS